MRTDLSLLPPRLRVALALLLPGGLIEDVRGLGAFQQSEERLCILLSDFPFLVQGLKVSWFVVPEPPKPEKD